MSKTNSVGKAIHEMNVNFLSEQNLRFFIKKINI